MKKILSFSLAIILCIGLFAGCKTDATSSATREKEETSSVTVNPLPETLDVNTLDNCTVAISLEKGDVYTDDDGKLVMNASIYSYELYDMADVSSLKADDTIIRQGEEIKITELERLESGLVRVNGGEENGGFDLVTADDTVYYEIGMSDVKAYYEIGKAVLPVSENFVYTDESDLDAEAKEYQAQDLLSEDTEYSFVPHNTSIVVEKGEVIEMTKVYMP